MMVKGFIFFRDGKMPFVIENYRMELFTDDSLLDDFCKEYNFKENYILHRQCFDIGIRGRKATFTYLRRFPQMRNLRKLLVGETFPIPFDRHLRCRLRIHSEYFYLLTSAQFA